MDNVLKRLLLFISETLKKLPHTHHFPILFHIPDEKKIKKKDFVLCTVYLQKKILSGNPQRKPGPGGDMPDDASGRGLGHLRISVSGLLAGRAGGSVVLQMDPRSVFFYVGAGRKFS